VWLPIEESPSLLAADDGIANETAKVANFRYNQSDAIIKITTRYN
jgi:hypothetical protein